MSRKLYYKSIDDTCNDLPFSNCSTKNLTVGFNPQQSLS